MLFYQTEGQFGDENFKVTAKELFLLDIGTATYTEYDPADPEVIKFLMANPEALSMKKGHIHSHNNMGVFFSETDNSELVDNCGFHNFYLSLIVNNKNEMCAKIAFKAKTKSENNIIMTFLDENGKEREKKMLNKNENESIYVYKCDVIKGETAVEDSFKSRFQEVKTIRDKKSSESAFLQRSKDWINGQYYKQTDLFDGYGKTVQSSKKEEIKQPVNRVTRTDPKIYSMLVKLLSLDFIYEGSLGGLLEKLNSQFYPLIEEDFPVDEYATHLYYDAVESRALEFYIDAFPDDTIKLDNFGKVIGQCVELLELYENQFPELIDNLTEALNLEIQ